METTLLYQRPKINTVVFTILLLFPLIVMVTITGGLTLREYLASKEWTKGRCKITEMVTFWSGETAITLWEVVYHSEQQKDYQRALITETYKKKAAIVRMNTHPIGAEPQCYYTKYNQVKWDHETHVKDYGYTTLSFGFILIAFCALIAFVSLYERGKYLLPK